MSEPKMAKYEGWWMPVTEWVHATEEGDFTELQNIVMRLRWQGVEAEIVLSKGLACVYRKVMPWDIDGSGSYFHEWSVSIRNYSVQDLSAVVYTRKYAPRPVTD